MTYEWGRSGSREMRKTQEKRREKREITYPFISACCLWKDNDWLGSNWAAFVQVQPVKLPRVRKHKSQVNMPL